MILIPMTNISTFRIWLISAVIGVPLVFYRQYLVHGVEGVDYPLIVFMVGAVAVIAVVLKLAERIDVTGMDDSDLDRSESTDKVKKIKRALKLFVKYYFISLVITLVAFAGVIWVMYLVFSE